MTGPDPRPRERPHVDPPRQRPDVDPPRGRRNVDIERGTGEDERVPTREGDTERTVGPEDEDRRVRPGERRPAGTMP